MSVDTKPTVQIVEGVLLWPEVHSACGVAGERVEYIISGCGFYHQSKWSTVTALMYSREQHRRDLSQKSSLQRTPMSLRKKVQDCHERIYGALNWISWGGDNKIGYCAALELWALLPNERNGSVTWGDEPKRTSSQLKGQPNYEEGVSTGLCLSLCGATCGYTRNGKKKKKLSYFFLHEGITSKSYWPTYPQRL